MDTGCVLPLIWRRHTKVVTRSGVLLIAALLMACSSGSHDNSSGGQPAAASSNGGSSGTSARIRPVIAGYLPTSNSATLALHVAHQSGKLTEVSPVLYTADPAGTVALTTPPGRTVDEARALHMSIIPVIQNLHNGEWDGPMIGAVLADPRRRAHHVQQVTEIVLGQKDFTGVDIDYEQLPGRDSGAYIEFLQLLSTELHRHHKLLAVAVPAKTADSADDPQSQAYPYDQIGAVADEVRVMAYDHAWEGSPPGSVAPANWVQQVLNYASGPVARNKLMLGIAAYGYDWADGRGRPLSATAAVALAAQHHANVSWDASSASAWFRYTVAGTDHTVWFENAEAMVSKVRLATAAAIRGTVIWKLGDEDPAFWNSVPTG